MHQTTAIVRISTPLASRGRTPETVLCCRGLDFRRASVTGREKSCRKPETRASANFAESLCRQIPLRSVGSTIAVAGKNTWRSCSWTPAARNPRPSLNFFQALSLGIFGREGFLFFGRVRKLDRKPRLADSLLDTEGVLLGAFPLSRKCGSAAVNPALQSQCLETRSLARKIRSFDSRPRAHVFCSDIEIPFLCPIEKRAAENPDAFGRSLYM